MRCLLQNLILLVLSMSCATATKAVPDAVKAEAGAVPVVDAPPAAAEECADQVFCTRDYRPAICQFNGQSFLASNACEAKKLAKRFACEQKLAFNADSVQCVGKSADKPVAAAGVRKECSQRTYCTKEMNPHSCVFGNEKFRGNNKCETMQKVRAYACAHGMNLDDKTVSCQAIQGQGR